MNSSAGICETDRREGVILSTGDGTKTRTPVVTSYAGEKASVGVPAVLARGDWESLLG